MLSFAFSHDLSQLYERTKRSSSRDFTKCNFFETLKQDEGDIGTNEIMGGSKQADGTCTGNSNLGIITKTRRIIHVDFW